MSSHVVVGLAAAVAFAPCCAQGTSYELIHNFSGADGAAPVGNLAGDTNGNLYGATQTGGSGCVSSASSGCGTVFKLTPPAAGQSVWTHSVLHLFGTGSGGIYPTAGPVSDKSGVLYGITSAGGSSGIGVIYKLTPPTSGQSAWTYSVVHTFGLAVNGSEPNSALLLGPGGVLYGTTTEGGTTTYGVVFELTPPASGKNLWTYRVIHNFAAPSRQTSLRASSLIAGANGTLYGTVGYGGTASLGIIYRMIPPAAGSTSWSFDIIHNFEFPVNGAVPLAAPLLDNSGQLFGDTTYGGTGRCPSGCGVIYQLQPPSAGEKSWKYNVIYNFARDGLLPVAPLTEGAGGSLYVTTSQGGGRGCGLQTGCGVMLKIIPPALGMSDWTVDTLQIIGHAINGVGPNSSLLMDNSGILYGTTLSGGSHNDGGVYRLVP